MLKATRQIDQADPLARAVWQSLRAVTKPGQRVMCALSGGADSLALLLATAEVAPGLGLEVVAGVVDHALRPGSGDEAVRLGAWCRQQGIELVHERVKVPREGGLEAAARAVRYEALERLAERSGADWIATGHTASDQAETVLLRLGRGAGNRGARGVLPRRGRVLRPLLEVSRAQVEAFLARRGVQPLVEDPSNADLARARNRIRHRVLPELRAAMGPGADAALARFARLARDDEAALEGWARKTANHRGALRELPIAVLRRWLRRRCERAGYAPNASELQTVARKVRARGTSEVELGRTLKIRIDADRVRFGKTAKLARRGPVELRHGVVPVPWARLAFELAPAPVAADADAGSLLLGPDVALPLTVRPVAPGDRIQGQRGRIRLKRLLIDRKVPRSERLRVAVVLDARDRILWVVGLRVSAEVLAAKGSAAWVVRARPLGRA